MIRITNKEIGIIEEYSIANLNFIRRSYDQYADKDMTDEDYKTLALLLTKAKYGGSRYENLEWEINVIDE